MTTTLEIRSTRPDGTMILRRYFDIQGDLSNDQLRQLALILSGLTGDFLIASRRIQITEL